MNLHTLAVNFLMIPTVLLSLRYCKEAAFSLSPISPWNISVTTDPSPLASRLSCPHLVSPSFLLCFSFCFPLHHPLPLSDLLSLFLSLSLPLCPRLCGVVYALFILLCNYECCSLYPHPYDEPDGYAGRWMVWVKKQSEKRVCLGRSHFPHDTSVHRPWPAGTRH